MSRILPRFTDQHIVVDHLEIKLAQIEAKRQATLDAMNAGNYATPDPQDLRGIPCIARGVGGTQPGTDPLATTIRNMSIRRLQHHDR